MAEKTTEALNELKPLKEAHYPVNFSAISVSVAQWFKAFEAVSEW